MTQGQGLERILRGPLAAAGALASAPTLRSAASSPTKARPLAAASPRPAPLRDLGRPLAPLAAAGEGQEGSVLRAPTGPAPELASQPSAVPPRAAVASLLAPPRVLASGILSPITPNPSSVSASGSVRGDRLAAATVARRTSSPIPHTPSISAPRPTDRRPATAPSRWVAETVRERIVERRVIEHRQVEGPQPLTVSPALPVAGPLPQLQAPKAPASLANASHNEPSTAAAAPTARPPVPARVPTGGRPPQIAKEPRRQSAEAATPAAAPSDAGKGRPPAAAPVAPESRRVESPRAALEPSRESDRPSKGRSQAQPLRAVAPRPVTLENLPRPAQGEPQTHRPGPSAPRSAPPPVTVRIGKIEIKPAKSRKAKPKAPQHSARPHQIDPGLGFGRGGR